VKVEKLKIRNDIPIYKQLKELMIKGMRKSGALGGDSVPSCREWAEKFGVSTKTAQKAIAELTEEGVIAGRPGKGTFLIKLPGCGEVCDSGKTIGILYFDIFSLTHPHLFMMSREIARACEEFGCQTQILMAHGKSIDDPRNGFLKKIISDHRMAGILIGSPFPRKNLELLRAMGKKILVMGNRYEKPDWPAVVIDSQSIAEQAFQLLEKRGFSNIGVVCMEGAFREKGLKTARDMALDAYKNYLHKSGRKFQVDLFKVLPPGNDSMSDLKKAAKELAGKVDAVYSVNSFASENLPGLLADLGFANPERCVVGPCISDNDEDFINVKKLMLRLASKSVETLMEHISGKKRKPEVIELKLCE